MLQLEQQLTIENPRKYSDAVVDQLENALREGYPHGKIRSGRIFMICTH